jgi:hypothetical protein
MAEQFIVIQKFATNKKESKMWVWEVLLLSKMTKIKTLGTILRYSKSQCYDFSKWSATFLGQLFRTGMF